MPARVVITGLGLLTPLGTGAGEFWRGLREARSGLSFIDRFDTRPYRVKVGGQLRGFEAGRWVRAQDPAGMDPSAAYAIAAARLALADAGLKPPHLDCFCGLALGGAESGERAWLARRADPAADLSGLLAGNSPGGLLEHLQREFAFTGRCAVVSNGCTTGADAVGLAFRSLKWGLARHPACLAGGAEAPLTPLAAGAFDRIRALSAHAAEPAALASRPFDRDRDGFVPAEGAAFVVLEELGSALARGARIYAELAGYGSSADACHMTQPDPQGTYNGRALRLALREAGLEPEDVDYVNAHGSSTPLNDRVETASLKAVFGAHARRLLVSSTKSQLGHMLGAAGSAELAATALGLFHGLAPPTINYSQPDPDCDLDYVPNAARACDMRAALSNSLGFGGLNAALALKRHA